jgi:hypothetical protein
MERMEDEEEVEGGGETFTWMDGGFGFIW